MALDSFKTSFSVAKNSKALTNLPANMVASRCCGPLIVSQVSRESVDKLNAFGSEENCMVAIYTARPSHPPADATGSRVGYSPEAELALQTAHIEGFPLVGME